MARKQQTRGKCVFCKKEMTRGGMSRHLTSCSDRQNVIDAARQKGNKAQTLYHLQVQDAWGGDFWLHLEMKGSARLSDLDNYLRAIWLECCGHLSQFSFGGWSGQEISMSRRISDVLSPGAELTHIYDFGTESVTTIKAVRVDEGPALSKHPIFLMARNEPPAVTCMECDRPATWLCIECLYEDDKPGTLCDIHAEDHPHDDYGGPVQIYNSPRMGLCGYDGPAEPPY